MGLGVADQRASGANNGVDRYESSAQWRVLKLTGQGHSGEVFAARFDPAGHLIASGSMDRSICKTLVWNSHTRRD